MRVDIPLSRKTQPVLIPRHHSARTVVAVVGRSGVGKSTLIAAGRALPGSGNRVGERLIDAASLSDYRRQTAGHQDVAII